MKARSWPPWKSRTSTGAPGKDVAGTDVAGTGAAGRPAPGMAAGGSVGILRLSDRVLTLPT
ncbi:hypothetical protein LNKW23_44730 [Paralimibaculum aggregatum]|uniref:Uncharacterized protein n=1 Tax=Paralimibaculum aggregatum TaxID=3036245 RepID=A0ABQ6LT68_9RHOB|nr:hypothetical protein LNKW23_44730 [Limibaculum sp. NKW23]